MAISFTYFQDLFAWIQANMPIDLAVRLRIKGMASDESLWLTSRKFSDYQGFVFYQFPTISQSIAIPQGIPQGGGFQIDCFLQSDDDYKLLFDNFAFPGVIAEVWIFRPHERPLDGQRIGYFVVDHVKISKNLATFRFNEAGLFKYAYLEEPRPLLYYAFSKGTLDADLAAGATSFSFTRNSTENPIWTGISGYHNIGIKIDNEIILAETASDADPTYTFYNCLRGQLGTTDADHSAGAEVLIFPIFSDMSISYILPALLYNTIYHHPKARFGFDIDEVAFDNLNAAIYAASSGDEWYGNLYARWIDYSWKTMDGNSVLETLLKPYGIYLKNAHQLQPGIWQNLGKFFEENAVNSIIDTITERDILEPIVVETAENRVFRNIEQFVSKNEASGDYEKTISWAGDLTIGYIAKDLTLEQDFVSSAVTTLYSFSMANRATYFLTTLAKVTLIVPLIKFIHLVPGDYVNVSIKDEFPCLYRDDVNAAFVLSTQKDFARGVMEITLLVNASQDTALYSF